MGPLSNFESLILFDESQEKESKEEKESHDSMKPLLSVTDPVNDLEEYKSIGMYDNLCMQGYLEIKEDNTPYSDDKVQKYVKDTDKNDIPFHLICNAPL